MADELKDQTDIAGNEVAGDKTSRMNWRSINWKGLWERISWRRIFSWAVAGFIVATILTIYFSVFYERPTEITYEILSQTPVLDIKEDVSDLDVLYKDRSIRKTKEQLTIILLKVENTGRTAILEGQYDSKRRLGFTIDGGAMVERPYSIDYSEPGLSNPRLPTNDLLGNVRTLFQSHHYTARVLNPGDYWTDRVLIIHDIDQTPSIVPIGKVGNVKEIQVVTPEDRKDETVVWSYWWAFAGGFVILAIMLGVVAYAKGYVVGYKELMANKMSDVFAAAIDGSDQALRTSVMEFLRMIGRSKKD